MSETAAEEIQRLSAQIGEVIRGKDAVIAQVVTCLLAGGHVLVEDLPGMGKTTLAYSLAHAIAGAFGRIQFTSDLLPADVLGVSVYNERTAAFEFKRGPVFCNILLADEINRSTPKTQSALLEVMDRGRVTIDGETYVVGKPFMVFATQNPVDYEGTFPLPDSQMDRFLMCLEMGYPAAADEMAILRRGMRSYDQIDSAHSGMTLERLETLQAAVNGVYLEDSVLAQLLDLVQATRDAAAFRVGISPRGALALRAACQARAFMAGRDYVVPEDIAALFAPVCAHRLRLVNPLEDPLGNRRHIATLLEALVAERLG